MTTDTIRQDYPMLFFIFIILLVSSFVLVEPAPYDLLLLSMIIFALLFHHITYAHVHFWPVVCLLLFLLFNVIASYQLFDVSIGIRYSLITVYLIISWIGLSGICYFFGPKILPFIFNGYVVTATISVLLGILAYMEWVPQLDFLLQFGRVKGFFKDPNVFGPFLIPATLYCLWRSSDLSIFHKKGLLFMLLFVLLSFGILLSFSRAAWGNFIIVLLLYFLFLKTPTLKRLKMTLTFAMIVIPLLYVAITSPKIGALFTDRFGLQAYDENRFSNQATAVDYILEYPLGAGPGQSESLLPLATHSLYVRLIFESGFMSLLSFLCFFLICLGYAIRLVKLGSSPYQGYFIIIAAALVGILFNSIFIDTLHWRHTWLLCALPFMNLRQVLK